MDVLSLIGITMAFVAIIGGNYLEGGHLSALINGPAALIVLGGTLAASLLQSPMSAFKRAMQIAIWILFPPRVDLAGGIDRVVNWSLTARKEGLLGLEGVADAEPEVIDQAPSPFYAPFLKFKGNCDRKQHYFLLCALERNGDCLCGGDACAHYFGGELGAGGRVGRGGDFKLRDLVLHPPRIGAVC